MLPLSVVLFGAAATTASKLAHTSRGDSKRQRRQQESTTFESFFDICYIVDGSQTIDLTLATQTLAVTYNNLVSSNDPFQRRMMTVDVMETEGRRKLSEDEIRNLQFSQVRNLNVYLRVTGSCLGCPTQTKFTNQVQQRRRIKSSKSGKGGSYAEDSNYIDETQGFPVRDDGNVYVQPGNTVVGIPVENGIVQPPEYVTGQPGGDGTSLPVQLVTLQPIDNTVNQAGEVQQFTMPSNAPSVQPSSSPSNVPSVQPSQVPSVPPSALPSILPSITPTGQPSSTPSGLPSGQPSSTPSMTPTMQPSPIPSITPSAQPSSSPIVSTTPPPSLEASVWVVPTIKTSPAPSVRLEDDRSTNSTVQAVATIDFQPVETVGTTVPANVVPTEEELRLAYADAIKQLDCHILDVLTLHEVNP